MGIKVFDICDSLYTSNTTFDFCEYRANFMLRMFLKLLRIKVVKLSNKISIFLFDFDFIRRLYIHSLKGVSRIELDREAELFVKDFLSNRKIIEAHEYLELLSGENILLLSATIDPVAKAIAEELGGVKYQSSTILYENGISKGVLDLDLLGNKQEAVKNQSIDFVITDNKSDLDLCTIASEVVIVSKRKDIGFWKNSDIEISRIIEVQ